MTLQCGRAVCHNDPVSPAFGKSEWAFGLPRHYLTAVEFNLFTKLGRESRLLPRTDRSISRPTIARDRLTLARLRNGHGINSEIYDISP